MPFDTHPSPFRAEAKRLVAEAQARRDAWTPSGVSWSGLTHNPPPVVPSVDEVVAELERREAARQAFLATPAGRFFGAANAIYAATGDDSLLACHSRGLDTNIHHAARLLAGAQGPAADAARAALAEFVATLQSEAA